MRSNTRVQGDSGRGLFSGLAGRWSRPRTLGRDGVGLVGYARGEFGIAETLRAHAVCLESAGVDFSVRDVRAGIASRQGDTRLQDRLSRAMPHWANIIFVNAILTGQVFREIGARRLREHYNIGYWLWELEEFPQAWTAAFDLVDEVWVPTRFIQKSIAAKTTKPVVRIPMPIGFGDPGRMDLSTFGIAPGQYVFLCSFDFNSYAARKNPIGAIKAFQSAFADGGLDACLLIKTINGDRHPGALAELRRSIASDERIRLHDGFFGRTELLSLLNAADTFVSLHRSEGFGLQIAESMFLGKSVIATGYSGNMDFMTEDNSFPVRYGMRALDAGEYPECHGQRWAEPDLQHAAQLMRQCVDGSIDAERIGRIAARSIREACSPQASAEAMVHRLGALGVRARR
jgi:glycosyltransferase involved in cell wall biosynthesis